LSEKKRHDEDLFEFAKILGRQSDFQEILCLVAQKAAQFFKADLALILMLNPDTRKTVKTIIKDGKNIEQKEYRDIHIHVGGWIINNQKSFISPVIQQDERFANGLFDRVPVKSVAGVPLIIEGIIIGALILLYRESLANVEADLIASLENLAAVAAPYLRNAQKIREYFASALPETSLLLKYNNAGLFGKSERFIELLHAVEAAAKCDARVLLIGSTGTGKELIAKAIHSFSSRANAPFIAVDCGAVPQNLMESEFFGHKRGAFTGATSDRQGLFLEANEGTLFMDEINNLPNEMQAKLLRVLQEGEVRPVGSDRSIHTNVRIVTASSMPLKKMVEEQKFREDLFFRLHVYPIYVPDLSERKQDIPLLAKYFMHLQAEKQDKTCQGFHDDVLEFMMQRPWQGNIRELENFVERLVTLTQKDTSRINSESFPADLLEELNKYRESRKQRESARSLKGEVQDFEAQLIRQTLIDCDWNRSETARRLKTSEKNIRYKIEKLDIQKPTDA
jgi:transcriptional regulator with GAF, ATPase, and Fis domain